MSDNYIYDLLKTTIIAGGFKLKEMLRKITSAYITDDITTEQQQELLDLARTNADPNEDIDFTVKGSEWEQRINELEQKVKELTTRVEKVEGSSGGELPEELEEYQVGKWYYKGMQCIFEGYVYECIAPEGQVCTWSPTEYPTYWQKLRPFKQEESEVEDASDVSEVK